MVMTVEDPTAWEGKTEDVTLRLSKKENDALHQDGKVADLLRC
jgi:hypothetical protein